MADHRGYVAAVFGAHMGAIRSPRAPVVTLDFLLAGTTVLGALAVATWALAGPPHWRVLEWVERAGTTGMIALRRLHSGCVNDYIAWLVAGLAVIGGALALV